MLPLAGHHISTTSDLYWRKQFNAFVVHKLRAMKIQNEINNGTINNYVKVKVTAYSPMPRINRVSTDMHSQNQFSIRIGTC